MQTTTLSGPAGTLADARSLLTDAGHFVLSVPTHMHWLDLAEGEAFLSVDGSHSDVAQHVAHLGWRHRGTIQTMGAAGRAGQG